MSGLNLQWLPLDCLQASLAGGDGLDATEAQHTEAQAHLEGTSLKQARLRRAHLVGVHLEGANLDGARLERALLNWAHLQGASLNHARLAETFLTGAHLEGAHFESAHLMRTSLYGANLQGANLHMARVLDANLDRAHLERANLSEAWLTQSTLRGAHLERTTLDGALLVRADLSDAHLEGADLDGAHLEGANLTHAYLDSTTDLTRVICSDEKGFLTRIYRFFRKVHTVGPAYLANVRWNGADLTVVDWSQLRTLGEERGKRWWRTREESERAALANTQLALRLREAGLSDDADRFAYRAHICQRRVHLHRLRLLRWLFSWLLYIIAGYGYRPLRTLFWYLAVICGFGLAYYEASHSRLTFGLPPTKIQSLAWYEALVLSVSSFHGRGFFQPLDNLGDPVAILAAIEAVFGLFIVVSFIATFTQRYFGK